MKYIYYILGILIVATVVTFCSNAAHGNLDWVRAQYKGAVKCHLVGHEPKNMLAKNKHYFATEAECDKTIGHAL